MRFRNHINNPLVLFSFIVLFSAQLFAADFSNLGDCRIHYRTVVKPGATDLNVMDNWCVQAAKLNAMDVCADKKVYATPNLNSLSSQQRQQLRANSRQACENDQQKLAQAAAARPANNNQATSGPAAVAANSGPPKKPDSQFQECFGVSNVDACLAVNARAKLEHDKYEIDLKAYNLRQAAKAAADAKAQNLTTAERQQVQGATRDAIVKSAIGAFGAFSGGNSVRAVANKPPVTASLNTATPPKVVAKAGIPAVNVPVTQPKPVSNVGKVNLDVPLEKKAIVDGSGTKQGTGSEIGKDVASVETENKKNGVATAAEVAVVNKCPADVGAAAPCSTAEMIKDPKLETIKPTQEIGVPAEAIAQKLQTEVQATDAQIKSMPLFVKFNAAYNALKLKITEYENSKDSCVKKAERAEKFCLEGSSPGMKFAKGLIDYSGPVLALVRSAQKACSSTAKVTNIASVAVTVAKGACVATKLSCDSGCAATETAINAINTEISALSSNLELEYAALFTENTCAVPALVPNPICASLNIQKPVGVQVATALSASFQSEGGVEPGTTKSLIVKCHEKTRDIALMAGNLLGLLAAKGSAEKCAKQLATSGSESGGGVGLAESEYCEVAANTGTQFCKCQSSPQAEGCGQVLSAGPPASSEDSNSIGANLKSGNGLSNFAGSNGGSGSSNSDYGIGSGGVDANTVLTDLSGKPLPAGQTGSGGGGAAAGAGGGGGSGSTDPAAGVAGLKDDKKGGFGSFVGLGAGGAFGGGGRGGAIAGNGALSAQQQALIARKIASDKLSGEVTASSGLDNFSKVKKSYFQKADTFMADP